MLTRRYKLGDADNEAGVGYHTISPTKFPNMHTSCDDMYDHVHPGKVPSAYELYDGVQVYGQGGGKRGGLSTHGDTAGAIPLLQKRRLEAGDEDSEADARYHVSSKLSSACCVHIKDIDLSLIHI